MGTRAVSELTWLGGHAGVDDGGIVICETFGGTSWANQGALHKLWPCSIITRWSVTQQRAAGTVM